MAKAYRKLAAKASKEGGLDSASESLNVNALMQSLGLALESDFDDIDDLVDDDSDLGDDALEAALSLMLD